MRGAPAALSARSMPGAATEALNHDDLLWVTSAQTVPGLAHKQKVQLQLLTTSPPEKLEQEGGARREVLELFSNIASSSLFHALASLTRGAYQDGDINTLSPSKANKAEVTSAEELETRSQQQRGRSSSMEKSHQLAPLRASV